MRRILEASALGFLASVLLYQRTHAEGVPELARYGVGGLLIAACYAVLYPGDRDGALRVFAAAAAAGFGVTTARLWGVLTEEAH